jgi:hypothetical protein
MKHVQVGMRSASSAPKMAKNRVYLGEMGPDTAVVSRLKWPRGICSGQRHGEIGLGFSVLD